MNAQASRWKYSLRPAQCNEFGPVPEFVCCRPFVVLHLCATLAMGIGLAVVIVGVTLPERIVHQFSPRWDWVLMVSVFLVMVGSLYGSAIFGGLFPYWIYLGWKRFRWRKPSDDGGLCQGIAPSDEIETSEKDTLEASTGPGEGTCCADIRPHLGVRLCLRLFKPLVVWHRKELLRVRSRRLERLLENVRRTRTRPALESIVGRPTWSLRTRRPVGPGADEAEELLTETYHLGEYVVCLTYKQGRVIHAFGAVNPCDWDRVLWQGDLPQIDFAWPHLEIPDRLAEGAADSGTPANERENDLPGTEGSG